MPRRHLLLISALIALLLSACASSPRQAETYAAPEPLQQDARAHDAPARDEAPAPMKLAEAAPAAALPVAAPPAPPREAERADAIAQGGAESPLMAPTDPVATSEDYKNYGVNPFIDPRQDRLSTFAIDVDTASYAIARRKLHEGALPPAASVRVEEFINAFHYDYPEPRGAMPFEVNFEAAASPFDPRRSFLRVGVQGKHLDEDTRAPIHLVFLVDTSGSMQSSDKLGMVKQSLKILTENLKEGDTIAIATYAGFTTTVLEPTDATDTDAIFGSLDRLSAGGSTAMGSGLQLAYQLAYKNLKKGEVSRVIVCSDGDANVGATSHEQILATIRDYTQEGVTLSTIGFGMGNYKDTLMEQLANQGNGNYYYIDSLEEAEQVFEDDLMGTLVVIAKDVKIQVEFDPQSVASYRLLGYENRDVADKDFRNDAVDAGEIGAGHSVTALYELELRPEAQGPLATVRIRHKEPDGARAAENTYVASRDRLQADWREGSEDFQLALGAASFAEILRGSPHAEGWSLAQVRALVEEAKGDHEEAAELLSLINRAISLHAGPQARR
jgi:Ca-activated chloride channel family protein